MISVAQALRVKTKIAIVRDRRGWIRCCAATRIDAAPVFVASRIAAGKRVDWRR
jgi:hypothetical protein